MDVRRSITILLVVVLAAATGWGLALDWGLVFDRFQASQHRIVAWIDAYPALGAAAYVIATALGKITPVPGGIALMLIGGFLFGPIAGGLLVAVGAALSAGLVASLGRSLIFDAIQRRWGDRLAGVEDRLARDGFYYLLALRLLPVIPAWLVNLLPVAVPIPLHWVMLATFLGLLPISFIVASLGSRLAELSEATEGISAAVLLQPGILLPLLGLSILALAPAVIRHVAGRR